MIKLINLFFAVNFNISTHYDYELPKNFNVNFPENYSTAMKSMVYYDYSLGKFFDGAKLQPWFKNTTFIFCSDHWMLPNEKDNNYNSISSHRIPIIIYNPTNEIKKVDSSVNSQFDILETVLSIAGYKQPVISYGKNLLTTSSKTDYAFTKINSSLYQIEDSNYTLGFNCTNGVAEYLYNYKMDKNLKQNLINTTAFLSIQNQLTLHIKGYIQKATMQYNKVAFK